MVALLRGRLGRQLLLVTVLGDHRQCILPDVCRLALCRRARQGMDNHGELLRTIDTVLNKKQSWVKNWRIAVEAYSSNNICFRV